MSEIRLEDRPAPQSEQYLLVTASRRLRRHLLQQQAIAQRRAGCAVWPTPAMVTWSDWLAQAWQQLRVARSIDRLPLLLQPAQELALWERYIRATAHQELLNVNATARSAAATWQLLHDYEVRLEQHSPNDQDVVVWRRWAEQFDRHCRRERWISNAELTARLREALRAGWWQPPPTLKFVGFHSPTPAQCSLWESLREHCAIEVIEPVVAERGEVTQTACQDPLTELKGAAGWARNLLQNGKQGSIGVVVRDLANLRHDAEAIFSDVLQPQDATRQRMFHISLGSPLADYPVVTDALLLLRWCQQPIPIKSLSRLLRSPYVHGNDREMLVRASLDAALRYRGWREVSLHGLMTYLSKRNICPELLDCLQQAAVVDGGARGSPGHWVEVFTRLLNSFHWPGALTLGSVEYQTFSTWRDLLSRFAALALVLPEITFEQAVNRVTQMARQQIYQPLEDPAPVQIMGLAEAAGLEFDHLWLMGMSEDEWPPPPRPDPFLPITLQRQAGMPGASAELSLQHARRVTSWLRGAAADIVVSFPRHSLEQELGISPLFADLVPQQPAVSEFTGPVHWLVAQSGPLESLQDNYAPALASATALRGGAGLFQDQALCPFRCVAKRRLAAQRLAEIDPGISAADHGALVHMCLADLWSRWQDHAALTALGNDECQRQIAEVVNQIINVHPRSQDRFTAALWEIQRQRLIDLLCEWMELERGRQPFTVCAVEEKLDAQFGGIEVEFRLDRVDQVASGTLVIDFKTGAGVSVNGWFDTRIENPQLPLYALAADRPVKGIAFAQVRRGACRINGIGASDLLVDGVRMLGDNASVWDHQLLGWQTSIDALAAEISAGWAAVAPKNNKACRTCDVQPLCRIHEVVSAIEEGSDDAD